MGVLPLCETLSYAGSVRVSFDAKRNPFVRPTQAWFVVKLAAAYNDREILDLHKEW